MSDFGHFWNKIHTMLSVVSGGSNSPNNLRSMCMSFFVKCPKQGPVQGRFKKVPFDKLMVLSKVEGHMFGAIPISSEL